MFNWRVVISLLILMAIAPGAWSQTDAELPQIKGRIADEAAVLSYSQEHLMYQMLSQHQFASHHYVVVLTVDGAGVESPQINARRIWQAWEQKKKASSVLFVLFKEQRVAAIVAGDALSKKLDTVTINKILNETISTSLKGGDFDTAAMEGVKGIVGALSH